MQTFGWVTYRPPARMRRRGRDGSTITLVVVMAMLGTIAAAAMAVSISTRMRQVHRQISLEQAFYLAEAGAERAASRVAGGDETSTVLRGSLGNGTFETVVNVQPMSGGEAQINVASTGLVHGVRRGVMLRGLRRVSWARYAMWYDAQSVLLWIVGGESFHGPVYSRPRFSFHSSGVSTLGQARFFDRAWSAASSIELQNSTVNPIFDMGVRLSAPIASIASVDLNVLRTNADLVLDGTSTITLNDTNMTITNLRRGWTNHTMPIPSDGLVYVRTVTSGDSATRPGNITLAAPSGMRGRLTLVSENDINIVNHVRYRNDPRSVPTSTDALGLIANRHVSVQTSAPNDLEIFAHLIGRTGGLGVVDHNRGSRRGMLTVYGGIVNAVRQPVGTTGGTGYLKNYVFDKRFARNPPPRYPVLTDEYEWLEWEG